MTARVVYSFSVSLDGFINSPSGSLDWADVDEEIHSWFNDRAREAAALVYGRRLYETMVPFWPNALGDPTEPPVIQDFARVFHDTPKLVFSRTMDSADFGFRLVRDDIVNALPVVKNEFDGEIDLGGAMLAAPLVERNLIDEYRLVVHPVVLGGGTPFFPAGAHLDLRMIDTRRFENGAMLLVYRPR